MLESREIRTVSLKPEQVIGEIERRISDVTFLGIPIDQTLQDIRIALLEPNHQKLTVKHRAEGFLRAVRARFLPVDPFSGRTVRWKQDGVLIASISHRNYTTGIIPKISAQIGRNECTVIANAPKPSESAAAEWHAWSDAPKLDLRRWYLEVRGCCARWNRVLSEIRNDLQIHPTLIESIRFALLAASQRVMRYGDLLDRLRPGSVLVDYDRNARAASLVLPARSRSIPTATLVHGEVHYPLFYTPLLADEVFCWGEEQKQWFLDNGTAGDRIRITGFPRIEEPSEAMRDGLRTRGQISPGDLVVMFASNPIDRPARMQNIRIFCEASEAVSGFRSIIRLHPSETLMEMKTLMDSFPHVQFTSNTDMSATEALTFADIVVAHSSGFAGEALAMGRTVVILDATDISIGPMETLVRHAGVPIAHSTDELRAMLIRIRDDEEFRAGTRANALGFIRRKYASIGEASCRMIADGLRQCVVHDR